MEHVSEDALGRPAPVPPVTDRLRAWISWFGLARLVLAAVSTVIVCIGAFWLVRTPSPPAEAVLPMTGGATVPLATLAPPGASSVGIGAHVTEVPEPVLVHVAGAVEAPGVYRLGSQGRVHDAIEAAGGPTDVAELDLLNLAAPVADGSRVYVPERGELLGASPGDVTLLDGGGASEDASSGPVDINVADAALLETLPGVGPATAAAIVNERTEHGPFLVVDDLERVPGIGPAKLAALRDLVVA